MYQLRGLEQHLKEQVQCIHKYVKVSHAAKVAMSNALDPWAPQQSVQIEEIENAFSWQRFRRYRMKSNKQVTIGLRIAQQKTGENVGLDSATKAQTSKEAYSGATNRTQNFEELLMKSRILEAMLQRNQFQEQFKNLKNSVSAESCNKSSLLIGEKLQNTVRNAKCVRIHFKSAICQIMSFDVLYVFDLHYLLLQFLTFVFISSARLQDMLFSIFKFGFTLVFRKEVMAEKNMNDFYLFQNALQRGSCGVQ